MTKGGSEGQTTGAHSGTPDVFLSYASPDSGVADTVCEALESEGITCWIAPRNVVPGEFYAESIVHAIDASRVLVLVLSQNAASSPHVLREVERASSKRHPVISLRLDITPLPAALEYFLNSSHWLDASGLGVDRELPKLVAAVQHLVTPASIEEPRNSGSGLESLTNLFPPPADGVQRSRLPSRPLLAISAVLCVIVIYIVSDKVWLARQGAELRFVGGPATALPALAAPEKSVAVLPFLDMSAKKDQEYLSDGLSEELINMLAKVSELRVPARTSSFFFKGKQATITDIAKALGVAYVLEGSVRESGDTLRVTAQLIRAGNGYHVWSETYDRKLTDVFKIQDEIADAVVKALKVSLLQGASLTPSVSVSPEAYQAYLEGLEGYNSRTKKGLEGAVVQFNRAIAIDPKYALAYALLARTYSVATVVGLETPTESMSKARDAASKALAIDDTVAAAHSTLGFVYAHADFDWAAAEREFRRGIELNPSDASGHMFYSNSFLSPRGRHDEAIAEMRVALELDPLSASVDSFLGRTYLWARRYPDALSQLQKSTQRFPNFALGHERLAHVYTYLGRFDEAINEETKARLLTGEDPRDALRQEDALRAALAARGPHGYWEELLKAPQINTKVPEAYFTSYGIAVLYARLGEKDKALDSLERAYAERQLQLTELPNEPAFDLLRSDERFRSLLKRVGLTQ
jgi:TolB-like protein/Tfp pilus assembly protein PilF